MMGAADLYEVDIEKQDDLRYRWRLSRLNGLVIDEGVEADIAGCLAGATAGVDSTSGIKATVDGVAAGSYPAIRMQLESLDVALEVSRAMLNRGP